MLILDNLKQNFYQVLKRGRVLILAANDVDTLCASKILQTLLQADGVMYTLIPVSSLQSLCEAFTQHYSQANSIVTINCGGANPLQEVLELSAVPDVPIFVIDSHRPLDLENVYGSDQVKIVLREGDTVNIPKLDEISRGDEADGSEAEVEVEESPCVSDSEQEEDDADSLEPRAKRQRVSTMSTRREKREWTHRREDVLYRYYEFSYFDTCCSLVLYDTAWKLSKDSPQILWWGIVGLTDQLLHQRVGKEKYVSEIQELQHHVARHNRFRDASEGGGASGSGGAPEHGLRLSFSNELRLCLHRHWTFFESLSSSDYTTCRFRLWTQKGRDRMLECLAEMGLPLTESQQKFSAMDFHLREKVPSLFEKLSHKYGLSDLTYGSFHAAYGYRAKLSAADMALSCAALIESGSYTARETNSASAPTRTSEPAPSPLSPNNFLIAQDALSRDNLHIVLRGIEEAKSTQSLIRTQIQSCMDRRLVICLGTFMYACLDASTPGVHLLSTPLALRRLSLFIRHAWSLLSKRSRNLPFILSAPSHRLDGYCLLLGLPPLASDDHKNDMGRAFKYTSEKLEAEAVTDQLDPCIIELKLDERSKFLDHLEMLLAN